MISILHPSRGRADQAFKTAEMFISKAGCEVEYILSIDFDDPQKGKYLSHSHHGLKRFMTCIYDNRSAVDAINQAAKEAKENIFIVISDDFECSEAWGAKVLDFVGKNKDWILKTPDGIQDWVITIPIFDRKYYERFMYVYHPSYRHGWCDTELTCVAELTGRKIVVDIPFKHNHYTVTNQRDETYDRSDAHFEQGRQVFQERINRNFFLFETPGKMSLNIYTEMKIK